MILLWLFMVLEIAHFGYNGVTVCILIHQQLSAPTRKSSPIHSCNNHKSPSSTSLMSLSNSYRGDADLTASVEPA